MQDDIRMPIMVRQIEQLDPYTLGIEWSDGHKGRWRLSHVRRACQCATCKDEWTRKPLLDPESVDDTIQCSFIESIGRYALAINFTDGHKTGIFTYRQLRQICQCEECEKNPK